MDQPTAEQALEALEPLLGEWTLEAIPPQLYTDDRNVCRVYEMSIGGGEWNLIYRRVS